MKRAMRILIPILLAIVLVGCLIWYLFVYDTDFTRDLLLSQARYFESHGSHSLSQWFYDRAYAHANQDEDVAIELAEQYKSAGNYTKAEYTLANAIADGGTAKLYIALCKTYVEQDKLLDAVNMLNSISDTAIKAELDARRPAAPAAVQAPGFYTQYISVEIQSEGGTLYVSTDGEYPSVSKDPYTEPITLSGGETTIYAVSVGEDGLVSPLSVFGYTVGGVVEPVAFSDASVEAEIRRILSVSESKVLYTNELWEITAFTMPQDAKSYADLTLLPYLTSLTIENGVSQELMNIAALPVLEELTLVNCHPDEQVLSAIATLPNLERLTLKDCGLSTIEPLAAAQGLRYLDLTENNVRNISAISSMSKLEELLMSSNALTDLSALSGLSSLTRLDVSYNSLTSLAPLSSVRSLTWLDAGNNTISTLGDIGTLVNLSSLSLAHNELSDVAQLASCTALTELNLSNNALTDITSLSTLVNMQTFRFAYNSVTAIPAFPKDCALVTIDGSYNMLTSLEPLAELESLNQVSVDYNEGITSLDSLTYCPNLYLVNAFGTGVTDASALTSQSIIVNFDPTLGASAVG